MRANLNSGPSGSVYRPIALRHARQLGHSRVVANGAIPVRFTTADDLAHQGFAPAIADAHAWVATCCVDYLHDQLLSSDWKAPALPGAPDTYLV